MPEPANSLAGIFVAVLLLLAASWAVALYRETVSLRPWKSYQRQYQRERLQALKNELRKAHTDLRHKKKSAGYRAAVASLSAAGAALDSPAARNRLAGLERQLAAEKRELERAEKDVQILRSRQQELEYTFARGGGESPRRQLAEFAAVAASMEKRIDSLSRRKSATAAAHSRLIRQREEARARLAAFEEPIRTLEAAIETAGDEGTEVRQILVDETARIDRCTSCHIAIDGSRPPGTGQPFTAHPGANIYLRFHPPERFGCTLCHQGNGLALSSVTNAHGETKYWPEPLLRGSSAQASCQRCHEELRGLRGGARLEAGAVLLEKYGCFGCHKIAAYETKAKIGPPLTHVASKVSYAWILRWLRDPRGTQQHSRMPNFGFDADQATAVADFLFSLEGNTRSDEIAPAPRWDLVDRGRGIFGEARCGLCHPVNERGGTFAGAFAPDLSNAGSKLRRRWLVQWIEDPRRYHPRSRMPRFRFSGEERHALAEFLVAEGTNPDIETAKQLAPRPLVRSSVERGRRLVEEFGCTGCHDIEGLERVKKIGPELKVRSVEDKIGAELSTIGNKPLELLDFGTTTIPRTRREYLLTKLRSPRVFRQGLRMPDFQLPQEEREALVTLLLGFSSREMPRSLIVEKAPSSFNPGGPAGALIRDLQCLTCHRINGTGGDYAPDLSFEGSRVQRAWLEPFLRGPQPIRPLRQQMPKFNLSESEAATVAAFIATALRDPRWEDEATLAGGDRVRGEMLYRSHGCAQCHQLGEHGGAVGPDLTLIRDRLQPAWVRSHLLDPRLSAASGPEPRYEWNEKEISDVVAFLTSAPH